MSLKYFIDWLEKQIFNKRNYTLVGKKKKKKKEALAILGGKKNSDVGYTGLGQN